MSNALSYIIDVKDKATSIINQVKGSFNGLRTSAGSLKLPNFGEKISAGLDKVRAKMSGVGGMLIGAFSATAILGFTKSVVDYTSKIKYASDASGLSRERFQALSIAAKQNGVGMDQLSASLMRVRNVQGQIGDDKMVQDTFKKIGMSIEDVQNADAETLLQRMAKGIKDTGNASVAFDVLGRGAGNLLSTLDELAGGWDAMVARTKGGIISDQDIENIEAAGTAFETFWIKIKAKAAGTAGALGEGSAFIAKLVEGEGIDQAWENVGKDKAAEKKARDDKKKAMEEARRASEDAISAKKYNDALAVAKQEEKDIGMQTGKAVLSDKAYEIQLRAKVNDLIAASNEKGLDVLTQQIRINDALKAAIELHSIQKKLREDEKAAIERGRQELEKTTQSELDAEVETANITADYQYGNMDPAQQMAATEQAIKNWRKNLASAGSSEEKAEATKGLVAQLQERDRLQKEAAAKDKERANASESLMMRDRDLREAVMTPKQKEALSQQRQADLEARLLTEKDPDKRLAIKSKIMDEREAQANIAGAPLQSKSLSMGDVFERIYAKKDGSTGHGGRKDPAKEQVEVSKVIVRILERIEKKQGGMNP